MTIAEIRAIVSQQQESMQLQDLCKHGEQDPEYQQLTHYIHNGFPEHRSQMPDEFKQYWNVWSQLALDDDLIVCSFRLLIPAKMHHEILNQLHESHQGSVRTKQRARMIVCRSRVPDILWSHQWPQFTSKLFKDFSKEWGFQHITSSPRYPQSNGKIEATVKSMKKLIEASWTGTRLNEGKLARVLLQYRNNTLMQGWPVTCTEAIWRRFQPTTEPLPQSGNAVWKKLTRKHSYREQVEQYYNQHAWALPEVEVGTNITLHHHQTVGHIWNCYGHWPTPTLLRQLHKQSSADTKSLIPAETCAHGTNWEHTTGTCKPLPCQHMQRLPSHHDTPTYTNAGPTASSKSQPSCRPVPTWGLVGRCRNWVEPTYWLTYYVSHMIMTWCKCMVILAIADYCKCVVWWTTTLCHCRTGIMSQMDLVLKKICRMIACYLPLFKLGKLHVKYCMNVLFSCWLRGGGDVRGRDYSSDAQPSYLLYFVLHVHDSKQTHSRSSSWRRHSWGSAVEAYTIGQQLERM